MLDCDPRRVGWRRRDRAVWHASRGARDLIRAEPDGGAPRATLRRAMAFVEVARVSDLPPGAMKRVEVDGRALALFHTASGIHAIDGRCPHRGGPLAEGDLMGEQVVCPWHLWTFDVRTGQCVDVSDVCVAVHTVEVQGESIFVSVSAESTVGVS